MSARMMGTHQELDLLTSLLFTVTNEAQYKERIAKLHEQTTAHRQALDAAVKAKGEAEVAVRGADATMAERSQQAVAAETKAKAALDDLASQRAQYEAGVRTAADEMEAARAKLASDRAVHSTAVTVQTKELQDAKVQHTQAVEHHKALVAQIKQEHLKKENEFSARESRLKTQEALFKEREAKIAIAEADLTQRIAKMRSLAAG